MWSGISSPNQRQAMKLLTCTPITLRNLTFDLYVFSRINLSSLPRVSSPYRAWLQHPGSSQLVQCKFQNSFLISGMQNSNGFSASILIQDAIIGVMSDKNLLHVLRKAKKLSNNISCHSDLKEAIIYLKCIFILTSF